MLFFFFFSFLNGNCDQFANICCNPYVSIKDFKEHYSFKIHFYLGIFIPQLYNTIYKKVITNISKVWIADRFLFLWLATLNLSV